MRIFIDANLLIYLNTVKTPAIRRRYENFYLRTLQDFRCSTDVLVLDEVLYISRRKFNIPYEVSIEFIDSVVLPYVELLSLGDREYQSAVDVLVKYHINPSDALHVSAMKQNKIGKIASEDREFDKIRGIERVWL